MVRFYDVTHFESKYKSYKLNSNIEVSNNWELENCYESKC